MGVRHKAALVLIFSMATITGLFALAMGLLLAVAAVGQHGWPTTDGLVVSSYVDEHGILEDTTYSPVVIYDYDVDGAHLQGNRVTSSTFRSSERSWAEEVVNRYPVGEVVLVYYDPENPGNAVLEPGMDQSTWILIGIGGLFASIGIVGAVWAWRSRSEVSDMRTRRGGPAPIYNPGVSWRACAGIDLDYGEKVLWQGRPVKAAYVLSYGRQSIFLSLFALFFPAMAIAVGVMEMLLPILMIGVGMLALILGGIIWATRKRLKDYLKEEYILTTRRVFKTDDSAPGCQSIRLADFYQVLVSYTLLDRFFGTGSLVFSDTQTVDFACIQDAEGVRKKIVDAVLRARQVPTV